jgi:ribosomal-protein-alanine N-acetyltransferase
MCKIEPIHTTSLVLREFKKEDVHRVYVMSLEPGMQDWIPDQVYRSQEHASEVLDYLMRQYKDLQSPVMAPCVLGLVNRCFS